MRTRASILLCLIASVCLWMTLAAGNASAAEPAGLQAMRGLALELLRTERYEDSITVYREITAHTPANARSHYDLAAALSFLQRYEEAAAPIQSAVRLEPENVRAQEMAALIFLNLRRYEEAFVATHRAAELGEITAMYSLVTMYEKGLGTEVDPDKALYWAIQAAEHGHLGAMAFMAQVYRTGRLERNVDPARADAWARRLSEAQRR